MDVNYPANRRFPHQGEFLHFGGRQFDLTLSAGLTA